MRPTPKGLVVTGATALGVAAVLVLNPSDGGTSVATTVADGSSTGTTASTTPSPEAATTQPSAATTTGTGSDSATTDPATTSTSATSSAPSGVSGTYTGDAYESPYGAMQVEVTIENGTITNITWVQLPSDAHSQRINSSAAPTLVSEGLAAQSADVASVSGATYTSEGFRTSLQSALTQAGL